MPSCSTGVSSYAREILLYDEPSRGLSKNVTFYKNDRRNVVVI
ncbi:MAG TPA: hypothetical protein VND89_00965 [Acidimicrobiales bacterium]|nr:hypothetical protein [Acidimicrobiales bacterium]